MHLGSGDRKRYINLVSSYSTLFGQALNWLKAQFGYETDRDLAKRIVVKNAVRCAREAALAETDVIRIEEKAQKLFERHFDFIAQGHFAKSADVINIKREIQRSTFISRREQIENALGQDFLGSHDLIWAMTYYSFEHLKDKVAGKVDQETLDWLQEKVEERQRYQPLRRASD
jgi:hypothetical protein